jgi:hypothetical protein
VAEALDRFLFHIWQPSFSVVPRHVPWRQLSSNPTVSFKSLCAESISSGWGSLFHCAHSLEASLIASWTGVPDSRSTPWLEVLAASWRRFLDIPNSSAGIPVTVGGLLAYGPDSGCSQNPDNASGPLNELTDPKEIK